MRQPVVDVLVHHKFVTLESVETEVERAMLDQKFPRFTQQIREKGQRRLVLRLLGKRFGSLDAAAMARLDAADVAALDGFADRVLTAGSVEEVLSN